jgi:hypothetical protein
LAEKLMARTPEEAPMLLVSLPFEALCWMSLSPSFLPISRAATATG